MISQGAASWQVLGEPHPDYDNDIIRGLGIIDDICSFLYQPHAPRSADMSLNHQAVMALTSTHFCPWRTSNTRKTLLFFTRMHMNTLVSSRHIRHQANPNYHAMLTQAMLTQAATTTMPSSEAPDLGEPHPDYDYDIIRGLGLIDNLCSYLYHEPEPWQSCIHRSLASMRSAVEDNHRTLMALTSTHYYVARLSEARHALLYYRRSYNKALLNLRRHAHLLADRPTFRWAYLKHGWLIWPNITTSLIALTRTDVCGHLFTYMHSEEILVFTSMANFLADHPVRKEIVPSLIAIRRHELEEDMEAAEMRALQMDMAEHDPTDYLADSD